MHGPEQSDVSWKSFSVCLPQTEEEGPHETRKERAAKKKAEEEEDKEEDEDREQVSKKKKKLAKRLSIAELKQLVRRPDVVEVHMSTCMQ